MAVDIKLGDNFVIGVNQPVFVIAEIGQNHQGSVEIAKKLISAAKRCGADCAKFQKTHLQEKFTATVLQQPYDSVNSWGRTYGEHKSHLEFSPEQFAELQQHCRNVGIMFAATAMDLESLKFLCELDVPFVKIGSGDCNNFQLLAQAADAELPIILSSGMQNLEVVRRAYNTIGRVHKRLVLMHCVSAYPAPLSDIHLNVLRCYRREFPDVHLGYSGHEWNDDVVIAAVALGAKVIERHITLDRRMKGTDHACSLQPAEFASMVSRIRSIELALGTDEKLVRPAEVACFLKLRKCLVYANDFQVGHVLTSDCVKCKVTQCLGVDAAAFFAFVGKRLIQPVSKDDLVKFDHIAITT